MTTIDTPVEVTTPAPPTAPAATPPATPAASLAKELLAASVHFGHRASRWNPKMAPYIHGKRNGVHIIDLRETVKGILRAQKFLQRIVAEGKDVLFVGTKKQIRDVVKAQVQRAQMHYCIERWLGGTLTNFRTIRSRLGRLEQLEKIHEEIETARREGRASPYSKKAESAYNRERNRIESNLGGIRKMHRLPGVAVLVDIRRELNSAKEARKLGIPVICLIDTDGDPDMVDLPIPGNDDNMNSVEIIMRCLADACIEGLRGRVNNPDERGEGREDDRQRRPRRPRGTAAERMMGIAPASSSSEPAPPATAAEPVAASETPAG